MSHSQRPVLKRVGVGLVGIGFALPLGIHFGREWIYRWLSGGSVVPDQDGMVWLLLAYVLGIPGGILLIVVGGLLYSRGRRPARGGRGFEVRAGSVGRGKADALAGWTAESVRRMIAMESPGRSLKIDELRARVRDARLGVYRRDAASGNGMAFFELTREQSDAILAFLTDEGIGGSDPRMVSLSGGWKGFFVIDGHFTDGTPFTISLDSEAEMWRGTGAMGDQCVRPGLVEHLRPFTHPEG